MKNLDKASIKTLIKPRLEASHKGDHGHALLIAGNKGRMGAGVIASKACLRSGVGLVSISVPANERLILQTAIPEAMLIMREAPKTDWNLFSAAGIGPGLGISNASEKLLITLLDKFRNPIILDADALNIIATKKALFKKIPKKTIITPHPKEFDRLFGVHKNETARKKKAVEMSNYYSIIIVLKGAMTLIAFEGKAFVNTSGNAGLAKAGSGDALTGIITAFLAQGYHPFMAAKIGVYLHGVAADITLKKQSTESMLITDVIENIGNAFKKIMK